MCLGILKTKVEYFHHNYILMFSDFSFTILHLLLISLYGVPRYRKYRSFKNASYSLMFALQSFLKFDWRQS